ncbi:MAG: hypothetical protein DME23_12580 [Verrucomicrobia bacterium]|nr:MAG: hypothetical protein DME23_12580 [Verrucomicrobiota bacterium]
MIAVLLALAIGYSGFEAAHLSSENNVSAFAERLRDNIANQEEYKLDDLELARQAGPAALPLLQRTLRVRDSRGYTRCYDRLLRWLRYPPLAKLANLLPPPERAAEQKRAGAARMLESLGVDAAPALKAQLRALEDESPLVRWHAGLALLQLGGHEAEVMAAQRRRMENRLQADPAASVYVLARIGPPARTELPLYLPGLAASTNLQDLFGRLCLPWILAQVPLTPPAQSFGELLRRTPRFARDTETWRLIDAAVEPLKAEVLSPIGLDNNTNADVAKVMEIDDGAALGIAFMGSLCSNLAPTLKGQLASPDSDKRFFAGFAWWHVTGDGAGSAQAMGSTNIPDDSIAQLAFLLTMHDLGASAAPAAQNVAGFLTNSNVLHRRLAARSLGQMGEAGRLAVPKLERCLGDECLGLRLDASEALWNLTHDARHSLSALAALLEDRSPRRRGQAARLLQIMSAAAVPPALLKRAQSVPPIQPDFFPSVFEVLTRMVCQPR